MWEAILTTSVEPTAILSADATVLAVNSVTERVAGRRAAELVGKKWFDVFCPVDTDAISRHQTESLIAPGQLELCRTEMAVLDGHYLVSCTPARDSAGEIAYAVLTATDITALKRNEATLRERERILDETGRVAKIGGWEHDLESGQATWTQPLYDIVEIESGPPPGPNEHLDYYPPESRALLAEAYRRAVEEGVPFDLELECTTAKGRRFWARAVGEPVFRDGRCVKLRGTFQDITRRILATDALRQSEERFRSIVMNAPLPGFILRVRDSRTILVNHKFTELAGYALEEIQDARAWFAKARRIPDDKLDQALAEDQPPQAMSKEAAHEPVVIWTKDGARREWVLHAAPYRDQAGEDYLIWLAVDMTDRNRALQALHDSERRYRQLHESMMDAYAAGDAEGHLTEFNRAFAEMLGYTPDELRGMHYTEFTPPRWHEMEARLIREQLPVRGYTDVYEKEYRRKDGSVFPVELRTNLVRDEAGRPESMWCIVRDITQRKRTEHELRQIEWLLTQRPGSSAITAIPEAAGIESLEATTAGEILSAVGVDLLRDIAMEFMDLLGTSCAICEKTGDYALLLLASSWCKLLDRQSREHCGAQSLCEAMASGKWYCHESRWTEASRRAVEAQCTVDVACSGGLRLYAVPIWAHGAVVGTLNCGYGDPPHDPETLKAVADRYGLGVDDLAAQAAVYETRPPYIVALAKRRAEAAARLIGLIVEQKGTEAALRESERKLTTLMNNLPGMAYRCRNDADWTMEFVSSGCTALTGYAPEDLIASRSVSYEALIVPEDRETVRRAVERALEERGSFELEYRIRAADGTVKWVWERGVGLFENERIVALEGFIADVNERREAQRAVLVHQERLSRLMDHVPGVVYRRRNDRHWTPEFLSEGVAVLTGYAAGDLCEDRRLAYADLILPEDRAHAAQTMRDAVAAQRSYELRYRIRAADGAEHWVWEKGQGVYGEDGKLEALEGLSMDITSAVCAENALREAEARLRLAMESAAEGMWEWDIPSGRMRHDELAAGMLGYAPGEIPEDATWWREQIHEADREGVGAALDEYLAGRTNNYRSEYRMRRKDGQYVWVASSALGVRRDAQGQPTVLVGIRRDISERVALEQQLRQAQKMEAIGQLAGGVAHDFNNILTAVFGNLEMMLDTVTHELTPAAPIRASVREIERNAQRAAALTRQLLAFSRRQTTQPVVLDVNQVLCEAEQMIRRLLTENIILDVICGPRLNYVRADPAQVEQVLVNLAVNARDAMPRGGRLTFETKNVALDESYVTLHPEATAGPHVLLAVSDTGCGMDTQTRERIFEPFFTTKGLGHGTGLGLATVYGIVKQSAGHIMVYSEPGRGTSFKLYLPASVAPITPAPKPAPEAPARGGTETILVCEDEPAVRSMLARMLQGGGYHVLSAGRVSEARKLSAEHQGTIELLITDVVMPDANGKELAESLRTARPDLRVLFISGYTSNVIAHHGVIDANVEFLEKPFTRQALLQRVRTLMDQYRPSVGKRSGSPSEVP